MNYRIEAKVTEGALTEGTYVRGESIGYTKTGRIAFRSTWAGTFDGIRLDTHDGKEMYAYFVGGDINGVAQGMHGFPVANLEN